MPKKTVAVFAADANPAVDPPSFHVSSHEAAQRVVRHGYRYLSPSAIQPHLAAASAGAGLAHNGSFRSAWRQAPSGPTGILVWQMRRGRRQEPA